MTHLWPLWIIVDCPLIVTQLILLLIPATPVGFAYNPPYKNSAHKTALTAADFVRLHSERSKK